MRFKTSLLCLLSLGFAASVYAATPYDDVPLDHWAYDAVKTLHEHGIVDGYSDGTFQGDKPITRFEMAKMIREAVLSDAPMADRDRRLLDKLSEEYKEELKGFNVRIVELERKIGNIRWNGNIRYRYVVDTVFAPGGGGGFMAMFGGGGDTYKRRKSRLSYATATLEPDIMIAPHWTGHLRMNYNVDLRSGGNSSDNTFTGASDDGGGGIMAMFGGGSSFKGRRVKEFSLDRIYLHGDYKDLDIKLGRLPYKSFVDRGMVMDDNVTGASVVYGKKLKGSITVGRVSNNPYHFKDDDAGGIFAMFGGGSNQKDEKTSYVGLEVYATPGKGSIGVGYHHFGNRDFEDDGGGGIFAMFGGGGDETSKKPADIWSVGGSYQFDDIFGLNAAAAWNTRDDMGYSGSKRSWQVEATFGKKDITKAGNLSGYLAYRHLGNSVTWRPDYEVMASGQKGIDLGISYVLYKNIVASLRYFRGKNLKTDLKENTLFGEVHCYF